MLNLVEDVLQTLRKNLNSLMKENETFYEQLDDVKNGITDYKETLYAYNTIALLLNKMIVDKEVFTSEKTGTLFWLVDEANITYDVLREAIVIYTRVMCDGDDTRIRVKITDDISSDDVIEVKELSKDDIY